MAKGRNSTVIGVRVPDSVYSRIKALAEKEDLAISEWCKANLIRDAGLLPDGSVRSHHRRCSVNAMNH